MCKVLVYLVPAACMFPLLGTAYTIRLREGGAGREGHASTATNVQVLPSGFTFNPVHFHPSVPFGKTTRSFFGQLPVEGPRSLGPATAISSPSSKAVPDPLLMTRQLCFEPVHV